MIAGRESSGQARFVGQRRALPLDSPFREKLPSLEAAPPATYQAAFDADIFIPCQSGLRRN